MSSLLQSMGPKVLQNMYLLLSRNTYKSYGAYNITAQQTFKDIAAVRVHFPYFSLRNKYEMSLCWL